MNVTDCYPGGSIHCFFEGYFVYNRDSMPSRMDIFGQLWKEYGLSDSRYIFCDPLLLCMEALSVVGLGTLMLLTTMIYFFGVYVLLSADMVPVSSVHTGPTQFPHILADHQ